MNYLFQRPDFEDLLNLTAVQRNMPFDFIEKDYWVTYVLFRMIQSDIKDFVFKGGTSLTKGWGLLDRFSEDIDLLFFPANGTKSAKTARLTNIKNQIAKFDGLTYDEEKSSSHGSYRDACFNYSILKIIPDTPIQPHIRLEMGYRGNADKFEKIKIQSYLGEQLEKAGSSDLAIDVQGFKVPILDIHRTFVEKLFAIHSAFENKEVSKYYRHYYDIYKLILNIQSVDKFYGTKEFAATASDVASRSADFPNTKIPKDLNFANSYAFKVDNKLISEIDSALKLHSTLFFKPPPSATEILKILEQIIYR